MFMLSRHDFSRIGLLAFTVTALGVAPSLKADVIELTNGDRYQGKVVSMSATTVELQSEIQGKVILPREKVARITLREIAGQPTAKAATNAAAISKNSLGTNSAGHTAGAEAVISQLRKQGADPKTITQVREQVLSSGSPEAAQKFDELYGGLLSGKISLQDLRSQAQTVLSQAKAAKADLGDDGDMLDGYLAILEKFLAETPAPPTTVSNAPTATPSAAVEPAPKK